MAERGTRPSALRVCAFAAHAHRVSRRAVAVQRLARRKLCSTMAARARAAHTASATACAIRGAGGIRRGRRAPGGAKRGAAGAKSAVAICQAIERCMPISAIDLRLNAARVQIAWQSNGVGAIVSEAQARGTRA
ncbi:hypothetical protein OBG91_15785 [Lactococcus lactis]|nr:hypothetical protein [Lactococcus lactis]